MGHFHSGCKWPQSDPLAEHRAQRYQGILAFIQSANIFIGANGVAKLGDFNLATVLR